MTFADTHAHLYLEEFDHDRKEMVSRALEKGVRYLFMPNIDSTSIKPLHELSSHFPGICFPMMGLHPTSVKENWKDEVIAIEPELEADPGKFCAIGEIGIDLYWDKTYADIQRELFIRQMEWSLRYDLPAVIHTRNSMDVAISVIEEMNQPKLHGIFHCFSGNIRQAENVIRLGFRLGIGGVVTFKNSGLQAVVKEIPLDHLVLETDAPFLAPVPYRGKRNESAYIPLIAEKIAEIKQVSIEEVAEVTTKNALRIFKVASSR
jgi:TatD DNase family protein